MTETCLTCADHDALVAKIKDSFYSARDQGRTMHQAAEDERIHTLVEEIIRRHRAEALHEAARRVGFAEEWGEAPLAVKDWLHDRANQIERGE